MVLITGAGGKTGLEVIKALGEGKNAVRALVRRREHVDRVTAVGASEAAVGDMRDRTFMFGALDGIDKVYHICPNVSPEELSIGGLAIEAARHHRISHFVYHSVHHPQVETMPLHWMKMHVEEQLFESGLPFTILQPAPYMQNILAGWDNIVSRGIFSIPYDEGTRISMVDLQDVAQAAAIVLTGAGHEDAIYELCGPGELNQSEIATILSQKLGIDVRTEEIDRLDWERQSMARGLGSYQIETLMKMFDYYERFGFTGNSKVLSWILDRPGASFSTFVDRLHEAKN